VGRKKGKKKLGVPFPPAEKNPGISLPPAAEKSKRGKRGTWSGLERGLLRGGRKKNRERAPVAAPKEATHGVVRRSFLLDVRRKKLKRKGRDCFVSRERGRP